MIWLKHGCSAIRRMYLNLNANPNIPAHLFSRFNKLEKEVYELRTCDEYLNNKITDLNERIMIVERLVALHSLSLHSLMEK